MKRTPWVDIGTLTQPKGVKGRLGVHRAPGLFISLEGLSVFCAPPALEGPRHRQILREGGSGDSDRWVELAGVSSRDDARQLAGRHCLVRRDDLEGRASWEAPDDDRRALTARDWISWRIVDPARGFSARVVAMQPRPLQPLLIAESDDGTRLMAPLAEELIDEIDEERRLLKMTLPAGLERLGD